MANDADTRSILRAELDESEKLLWSGRPDPVRTMRTGFAFWFFAVPWTAFAAFWMWGAFKTTASASQESPESTMAAVFPWFGIPFLLVGIGMLSSPLFLYLKAQRTCYGITDKRVLIVVTGRSKSVESYSEADLGDFERKEQADGSGDLTFARRSSRDSEGNRSVTKISLVGIPNVRMVDKLMRDTFRSGY